MLQEVISDRGIIVVHRLILEPGESMHWHTDPCQRFAVVVRGDALAIEYKGRQGSMRIDVSPGLAEWEEPSSEVHRATNIGTVTYEQVTVFFLDRPGADPQPRAE